LTTVAVVALSIGLAHPAYGTAGALDPAFGLGGKVRTDFSSRTDIANGVAIQADGKLVVAGASGGGSKFAVARYNPDGSLDTTFSGNGKLTTDFTPHVDYANDLAIQSDGKIVVVGESGVGVGSNPKFAVARYNSDGSLDTTFGGDGRVTTDFTRHEDLAHGVAIQADAKIVAVGTRAADPGLDSRFALARYNPDGSLDATFGGDGRVTTNLTRRGDLIFWGVAIQPNGRIVVAGVAGSCPTCNSRFALARYELDGSLDATFGGDGKVTTDLTRRSDPAYDVTLQADGKIVVAGDAGEFVGPNPGTFALARYHRSGTLDETFSGDGKVRTDLTRFDDGPSRVAIQTDGKIIVAGVAGYGGANAKFALLRYRVAGRLDAGFSADGKLVTDFTAHADYANGLTLQGDGKIVAAGVAGEGGSNPKFAVARYLAA
jgi:uncharacterized delta-60 repeat protein